LSITVPQRRPLRRGGRQACEGAVPPGPGGRALGCPRPRPAAPLEGAVVLLTALRRLHHLSNRVQLGTQRDKPVHDLSQAIEEPCHLACISGRACLGSQRKETVLVFQGGLLRVLPASVVTRCDGRGGFPKPLEEPETVPVWEIAAAHPDAGAAFAFYFCHLEALLRCPTTEQSNLL
jgi:hypothetical protein